MPELPEVETVRRTLTPVVVNKFITACKIMYPRVLPLNSVSQFSADIVDQQINAIKRRGKYLIFKLDTSEMIIHLRMTGQLIFNPDKATPLAKHTSAILSFGDDSELRFVDQRKFGTIYLIRANQHQLIKGLYSLGPEPLTAEFTFERFSQQINFKRSIKAILLDQKRIAGLGNIYSDEALFRAKIHPARLGISLTQAEIKALYKAINQVLQEAINCHGTTIRDYRTGSGDVGRFQNKLQVYHQTGLTCPVCNTPIEKTKVVGRTSHFCPQCQRRDETCMA